MSSIKQKTRTLNQLEHMNFITHEGQPATLYQVAYRVFENKTDTAMIAASAGDFTGLDALRDEINLLIGQFIQHAEYLRFERGLIADPNGPEAISLSELRKAVEETERA